MLQSTSAAKKLSVGANMYSTQLLVVGTCDDVAKRGCQRLASNQETVYIGYLNELLAVSVTYGTAVYNSNGLRNGADLLSEQVSHQLNES